ncbi:MAG TPA: helix-turn-helix domain-containing protein [Actinomycetota bacterium]|nr:helix-turn-helix domain-containing protein [Actinomycetota bacterium]
MGPALRTVREGRGLTLDEAARDTRVRRDYLEAIEDEAFDRLLGEVHVRGCLRTYASYLRLSPDKVVAMYESDVLPDEPEAAPATLPRTEPVLGARRRRDDHRLLVLIAVTVLVLAGAFGVLSARRPAPPAAELQADASAVVSPPQVGRGISVAVVARKPVELTVIADGSEPVIYELRPDEGRSFDADSSITVRLSEGASANVTVSGKDYGFPGVEGQPWEETFSYEQPSPSAG